MKNKSKITGNKNIVIQGSHIQTTDSKKKSYTVVGIIIAFVTLVIAIIVGWNNIVEFFNCK